MRLVAVLAFRFVKNFQLLYIYIYSILESPDKCLLSVV